MYLHALLIFCLEFLMHTVYVHEKWHIVMKLDTLFWFLNNSFFFSWAYGL